MRKAFLPFSPPCFGQEEIDEVADTLRSDWITTGPKTKRFEKAFADFVGAQAALGVSSCTDAMLVGLAALGIGRGDEVITTAMTFCSTVHVIEHLGARPILVDVEPDTLNIDPKQVGIAIDQRMRETGRPGAVRAIMPVHLYGHPCDLDAILEIAQENGAAVVEDAAHALAAAYKGRLIGSSSLGLEATGTSPRSRPAISVLTAFSFYATKNLTTAEGGMLSGPPALIEQARMWSLHGMSRDAYRRYEATGSWFYDILFPGYKCNMTDIQAALGLQQLLKLPRFQERRRQIVQAYNQALVDCDALQLPSERSDVGSAHHLYVVRLNLPQLRIDRARFIEELKQMNIGVSVHFIPVHMLTYYRDKYGYRPEDFPVAFREYQRIISLPLNPRMTDGDVGDVIEAVRGICARFKR